MQNISWNLYSLQELVLASLQIHNLILVQVCKHVNHSKQYFFIQSSTRINHLMYYIYFQFLNFHYAPLTQTLVRVQALVVAHLRKYLDVKKERRLNLNNKAPYHHKTLPFQIFLTSFLNLPGVSPQQKHLPPFQRRLCQPLLLRLYQPMEM